MSTVYLAQCSQFAYASPIQQSPPMSQMPYNAQASNNRANQKKKQGPRQFTPLPMPVSELYQKALAGGLIGPEVLRADARVPNNDPNARYEYHMGVYGTLN